jgi:hypothetical protein
MDDSKNCEKQRENSEIEKVGPYHPPRSARFKPGQSGNPKGHPKGVSNIASKLKHFGKWKSPKAFVAKMKEAFPDIDVDKLSVDDATWLRVRLAALSGEPWAAEFVANRTEGKPQERLDIQSGGEPLQNDSPLAKLSLEKLVAIEKIIKQDSEK